MLLDQEKNEFDVSKMLTDRLLDDCIKPGLNQNAKVFEQDGKLFKVIIQAIVNQGQLTGLRVKTVCNDKSVTIEDQIIDRLMLTAICSHLVTKLVLPQDKPLMHIDSFKDFCRICLFPFIYLMEEGN
jgi:hypothetical protein